MELSVFAISGLCIFMTSALMAVTFFVTGKTHAQRLWAVFCISVGLWGLGAFLVGTTSNPAFALWYWKLAYVGVLFIPSLFAHFVAVFLNKKVTWPIYLGYALSVGFLGTMLFSDAFVHSVRLTFGAFYYLQSTVIYDLFLADFVVTTVLTHLVLYRAYARSDAVRRVQIEYFFIATFVGYFGGSFSFLPVYGIDAYPYLNFLVALYPLIMGYAILRYRLFDVRVVTTVVFVALLNIFLAARILLAPAFTIDQFFDAILLVSTIVIGGMLVRSILGEIRVREQVEELAHELQTTNKRQEGLIHFIGHEVKGFLTKAQGMFSLLVEGDLGPLPEAMKPFVERALLETREGVTSVTDILKASNLKKGTVTYTKAPFDLAALVKEAAERARASAEQKGLAFSSAIGEGDFTLNGDRGEIGEHVLRNLLDNAVNYTPSGSVAVSLVREGDRFVFSVKDTGVGVTDEDKKHLFTEGGHGKESQKVNVNSTGYGLFIAKQVTEAHGGTISAESEGAGKGSTFVVELPADSGTVSNTPV